MGLKVTNTFLTFFNDNAELVSKKSAYWRFQKKVDGKREDYNFIFELFEQVVDCFEWIKFNEIRVPYNENLVLDGLQFYSEGRNFGAWKNKVLSKYGSTSFSDEDNFDFEFNYLIDVIGDNNSEIGLLFSTYFSGGYLNVGYDRGKHITNCILNIELRGEPFNQYPWGTEYLDFCLPKNIVTDNREVLLKSINKIKYNYGFDVESYGFEWGHHEFWKIDKNGFY